MHEAEAPAPETPDPAASLPEPATGASNRAALTIVFLVVFIDLLGFGIVIPLLPLYASDVLIPLFPGDSQRPLHGLLLGLLMSSFSFMQFLFAPMWGKLSDRIGRRPVLLLGLAGSVVFYTLFAIASELGGHGWLALGLTLLFIARLGAGLAGATIPTAQAVIADTTTPQRRAHGMALIGMAFGVGFTIGPLLGYASLFVDFPGAPGCAAAVLSLAALLVGLRYLPETLRVGSAGGRRRLFDWAGLQSVLRMPTVADLVIIFFLATFAFSGLESTLALVNKVLFAPPGLAEEDLLREVHPVTGGTRDSLKLEQTNFLIFAYVGFALMLSQGLIYRRFVQRVGEVRFLRAGVVLKAAGLAGAMLVLLFRGHIEGEVTKWVLALTVLTVAVMGYALLTPSVQALISRRSDPARQGEVLGVNQSAAAMSRILGPLVSITLFFLTPTHILPYLMGTVLLLVVLLLSLRIHQEP